MAHTNFCVGTCLRAFLCVFLAFLLSVEPALIGMTSAGVFSQTGEKPEKRSGKRTLTFDVSESKGVVPAPEKVKLASAQPLPLDRLEKLIKRLPPLTKSWETPPFKFPEQSLPRPDLSKDASLKTIPLEGEGPAKPKDSPVKPLEISRISQTGKVEKFSELAVSFSQPMVPIGQLSTVNDTSKLPISIKPQPPGQWRWANTQTLLFEPTGGTAPSATIYKCEIPAGITSILGGKLAQAKRWEISTSRPEIVTIVPREGTLNLVPTIVVQFNQKINDADVFKFVSISNRDKSYPLVVVPRSTIEKDKKFKYLVTSKNEAYVLAFKPAAPLPKNTDLKVKFKAGTPSAEGPLTTPVDQIYSFHTYGPLTITSPPARGLSPESWMTTIFRNEIDTAKFKQSMVTVSPSAGQIKVRANGDAIRVYGDFKTNSKYTITFDKSITDIYGQTLGTTRSITFVTGALSFNIERPTHSFIAIPTGKKPSYIFRAAGMPSVKVSIARVEPEAWQQIDEYATKISNNKPILKSSKFQPLNSQTIPVGASRKTISIDLNPYLKSGKGHLFITVQSVGSKEPQQIFWNWVQVSDIGLDAFSRENVTVFASSLSTGKPLCDVNVKLFPSQSSYKTDADGLTVIPAETGRAISNTEVLLARAGGDAAILPNNEWFADAWRVNHSTKHLRTYAVTDRNLYRPGEKVGVKGWFRVFDLGKKRQIVLSPVANREFKYVAKDSQGNKIADGSIKTGANSDFNFSFDVPKTAQLGRSIITLRLDKVSGKQNDKSADSDGLNELLPSDQAIEYSIDEFRRPEFEMHVSSSAGNTLFLGDKTTLTAKTHYFAGGSLPDAPITWLIRATPQNYSPPSWSDYSFGDATEDWWMHEYRDSDANGKEKQLNGLTDAAGNHAIDLTCTSVKEARPVSFSCEATVSDVNRQQWSDKVAILMHPSDRYVGIKLSKWFYKRGENIDVDVIATDIDGKLCKDNSVQLKLSLTDDEGKEKVLGEQTIKSGEASQKVSFSPKQGGHGKVTAVITDANGRLNETSVSTWIENDAPSLTKDAEQQTVRLIPDKKEYKPGDQAQLTINSPFAPAYGVFSLRREGMIVTRQIELASSSLTVDVPIDEDLYPNVTAQVDLVGKDGVFATGEVDLSVPARARKLALTATAANPALSPGGDTTIRIDLKDASGNATAGNVALAVVDEAVLALSDYKWNDPVDVFYSSVSDGVSDHHNRAYLVLPLPPPSPAQSDSDDLSALPPPAALPPPPVPGAPDEAAAAPPPPPMVPRRGLLVGAPVDPRFGQSNEVVPAKPITMRVDLSAMALFEPSIVVGADGKAEVKLHLPGSVTRYRIMAIASSGLNNFGSSESTVEARLPLMVRPSAPRFLNVGDTCELPVVLQNQTDKPLSVEVGMRSDSITMIDTNYTETSNDSHATQPAILSQGQLVEVAANDRVEVRFPMRAAKTGSAKFQFAASTGDLADAQELTVPVMTPASTESFTACGELDEGAIKQVFQPLDNVFPEIGGLDITTSSTAMQELQGAYLYLKNYSFGCSEQISSRVLATLSLADVLSAFGLTSAEDKAQLRTTIQTDIGDLVKRQNDKGGFALWKPGEPEAWPYVSLQVSRALLLAKQNDYDVPDDVLEKCKRFMRNIDQNTPSAYTQIDKQSLKAYALFLRYLNNDTDSASARTLIRSAVKPLLKLESARNGEVVSLDTVPVDKVTNYLPMESIGWLLPVISKDKHSASEASLLRRVIAQAMRETSDHASVSDTGYGDHNYYLFFSERRADAIILEAMIFDDPQNELIAKLVRGLLAGRKQGHWMSTQENAYVLMAINRYFKKYEAIVPNFEVKEWIADAYVGKQNFAGRSFNCQTVSIPMEWLSEQKKAHDILLDKVGAGRLYYRVSLTYASKNLKMNALDNGFSVARTYEAVDNPDDVTKDADGIWHIKAGSTVRVKLNFSSTSPRYHVALADPLPAGVEPLNPELSGSRQMFKQAVVEDVPDEEDSDDQKNNTMETGFQLLPPMLPPPPLDEAPIPCFMPFWTWPWFDHQNLRDHQAEAFASMVSGGAHDYSYMVRATTPGVYNVAPTKAEEMYSPETFGRTSSDKVIVE